MGLLSPMKAFSQGGYFCDHAGMRAREIKAELTENGVDTSDLFDKEDLATRLYELRTGAIHGAPSKTTPSSEAGDVKAEEDMEEAPSAEDFVARCRAMAVKELRTAPKLQVEVLGFTNSAP
ncbi:CLIP1 [Symbiodinium pilosum]|uniref:CLIP1 protein n=1 Tax=Symbiodinium pilosum TaxID=2952 RepID=A0A812WYR9_SYMPI|nr:CLIP1 [Symbiodinium pilosum]